VKLPPLPAHASDTDRQVFWLLSLCFGVKLADGDDLPVIAQCRMVAYLLDLESSGRVAARSLRRLVRWGVFEEAAPVFAKSRRPMRTLRLPASSTPLEVNP
jgi:hypothetical protein